MMNNTKTAAAAVVLSALSFGVFAAEPVNTTASQNTSNITNIEAGSNMVRGSHVTAGTNDAAFNAHTLVAGEWD